MRPARRQRRQAVGVVSSPKIARAGSSRFRISRDPVLRFSHRSKSRRQPFRFNIPLYRAIDRQIVAGKTPQVSNIHRFLEKDIGIRLLSRWNASLGEIPGAISKGSTGR